VHAGVGAIHRVDVAALVHLDVVGLDRDLAALFGALADAAFLGSRRDRRNVVRDLLRTEGIANVEARTPALKCAKNMMRL